MRFSIIYRKRLQLLEEIFPDRDSHMIQHIQTPRKSPLTKILPGKVPTHTKERISRQKIHSLKFWGTFKKRNHSSSYQTAQK